MSTAEIRPDNSLLPSTLRGMAGFIIRWLYWFAVPLIAALELTALITYGYQLIAAGWGGKLLLTWFSILSSIGLFQVPVHLAGLIPARLFPHWFAQKEQSSARFYQIFKRANFYAAINYCNYALLSVSSINLIMLLITQFYYVNAHKLVDQGFASLFWAVLAYHSTIVTARLLIKMQGKEYFERFFYFPYWKKPNGAEASAQQERDNYEDSDTASLMPKLKRGSWTFETTFGNFSVMYNFFELSMVVFAVGATFALSDYNHATDKIFSFFTVFHPCILIDHYPASIVGMVFIGLRELVNAVFVVLLFVVIYLKASPFQLFFSSAVLFLCLILEFFITDAFSAQLYSPDMPIPDPANFKLSDDDYTSILIHAGSYTLWLLGTVGQWAIMLWMMVTFKWPYKSQAKKYFWYAAFAIGNFSMVIMAIGMVIAIRYQGMSWTQSPQTIIQKFIAFLFNDLKINYVVLAFTNMLRLHLPMNYGVKVTVYTEDSKRDAKHGELGRGETYISLIFWFFVTLLVYTYTFSDIDFGAADASLFPIADAFGEKPFNCFFAPVWLIVTVLVLWSVVLSILHGRAAGWSADRLMWLRLVGLALVASCLMCEMVVVPFWKLNSAVIICFFSLLLVWICLLQYEHKRRLLVFGSLYLTFSLLTMFQRSYGLVWCSCFFVLLLLYKRIFPSTIRGSLYMTVEMIEPGMSTVTIDDQGLTGQITTEDDGSSLSPAATKRAGSQ